MSEQQEKDQDKVEKALGTGAKPAIDGDMAKGAKADDQSAEATVPGVNVPEGQADTTGATSAPAPKPAAPVAGTPKAQEGNTNG